MESCALNARTEVIGGGFETTVAASVGVWGAAVGGMGKEGTDEAKVGREDSGLGF